MSVSLHLSRWSAIAISKLLPKSGIAREVIQSQCGVDAERAEDGIAPATAKTRIRLRRTPKSRRC